MGFAAQLPIYFRYSAKSVKTAQQAPQKTTAASRRLGSFELSTYFPINRDAPFTRRPLLGAKHKGNRGSDPRLLGLTMGTLLARTLGSDPVEQGSRLPRVGPIPKLEHRIGVHNGHHGLSKRLTALTTLRRQSPEQRPSGAVCVWGEWSRPRVWGTGIGRDRALIGMRARQPPYRHMRRSQKSQNSARRQPKRVRSVSPKAERNACKHLLTSPGALIDAAEGWFMADRRDQKMGDRVAYYDEHGLNHTASW
jgi:hypothetical protein